MPLHRLPRVTFRAYYAPKTSAGTGQIVLAGATRRLIGDLFRLRDLGRQVAASRSRNRNDGQPDRGMAERLPPNHRFGRFSVRSSRPPRPLGLLLSCRRS